MQAMILRQMYLDFKSFLPVLLHYFKAKRVLFIDDLQDTVMVYNQDKKYTKYTAKGFDFSVVLTNINNLPQKFKDIIVGGYDPSNLKIISFGDLNTEHKWEVVIVGDHNGINKIEADIIIKAVKCCVLSYLR